MSSISAKESFSSTENERVAAPHHHSTVFGYGYNPGEDDEGYEPESYPKREEEAKKISRLLEQCFMIKTLDPEQHAKVINAMVPMSMKAGEILFKEGEVNDYFYLLESGTIGLYKENRLVDRQVSGFFGQLELVQNFPRNHTVKAETAVKLYKLSGTAYRKIVLAEAFKKRTKNLELLSQFTVLKNLPEYTRLKVADIMVRRHYHKGDVIYKKGDKSDGMYFIVSGTVAAVFERDGQKNVVTIETLNKMKHFGERGLMRDNKVRRVSVIAAEDLEVAFVDAEAFDRLLGPCFQDLDEEGKAVDFTVEFIYHGMSQISIALLVTLF